MGVGIVIRDDEGHILAAKAFIIPYLVDPAVVEATAAWHAICFGREVGGSRVVLEGDSKVVITALKGRGSSNHTYGNLIEATRSFFSYLTSVEVSHVKREGNKAAHVLARCAISQRLDNVWVEECPSLIHDIVLAERDISY